MDLDYISLPQNTTYIPSIRYIDDIMVIGPSEQEKATTLHFLVRYLHVSELKTNQTNFRVPLPQWTFWWSSSIGHIHTSKVKSVLLNIFPARRTMPSWYHWILEAIYSSCWCVTLTHLLSDQKRCQLELRTRRGSVISPECCAVAVLRHLGVWSCRSNDIWSGSNR